MKKHILPIIGIAAIMAAFYWLLYPSQQALMVNLVTIIGFPLTIYGLIMSYKEIRKTLGLFKQLGSAADVSKSDGHIQSVKNTIKDKHYGLAAAKL